MSVGLIAATGSGTFGGGSSKTFNHAGGTPDLATSHVAWVKFPSGTSTVGVTYGGAAMPQIMAADTILTSAGNGYVQSFRLASPGTGTQSVVMTFSSSSEFGYGGAITWSSVDTSNPIAATASATGTTSAPSVSVGSTSGNYCVDTLMANGATPTATLTQNWNTNDSGIRGASQGTASTGSAVNMAWTGSINQWVLQAYEIAQAAAASDYPLAPKAAQVW